jgi:hypothetical protein
MSNDKSTGWSHGLLAVENKWLPAHGAQAELVRHSSIT